MNLIEEYGSYESALDGLRVLESSSYEADQSYANKLKNKMLEYRRQHNIFEVGDLVVFRESSGVGGASDAVDLMKVKSIDAFGVRMTNSLCPWAIQIRHATDAEIKAGKRRPELDSDTCSDIRNHVSPLTKVIDR